MSKRKTQIILIIAQLILIGNVLVSHFFELPDFANGLLVGLACGLMIMVIIKGNFKKQPFSK